MTLAAETHPRQAPLHLWREAEQLIRQLCILFGELQQITWSPTLTAASHKQLTQWLRGCEAFVRQLLLIEAAALRFNAPPLKGGGWEGVAQAHQT